MWIGAESILLFRLLVIVHVLLTTKHVLIISLICWCKWKGHGTVHHKMCHTMCEAPMHFLILLAYSYTFQLSAEWPFAKATHVYVAITNMPCV